MKRLIVGLLLGTASVATPALAQQAHWMHGGGPDESRGMMGRFSPEDREAFTDARIAALRAGLKLSPDQEKLWPAVEEAIRGLVKQRGEQMREWREARRLMRDDFPAAVRSMAERQAAGAEALRRMADAAAPLYATLDESQKRRAGVLMRSLRPHRMMHGERDGHRRDRWHDRDNG
jgi:zinc resistance-associated protein